MAVPGASAADISVRDEFAAHFAGFTGTFVMYDPAGDKYIVYNEPQSKKRLSPCSTFKIYNSLIGLGNRRIGPGKMYTRCSNGTGRNTLSLLEPRSYPGIGHPGVGGVVLPGARRAHRPGTDGNIDKIGYGNKASLAA